MSQAIGRHVPDAMSTAVGMLLLLAGGALAIARIDFRRFIGYQFVYAAIWFVLGVLMFTVL